jgi:GGDEF domain-containing protein
MDPGRRRAATLGCALASDNRYFAKDGEDLLAAADRAMYRAKASGGGAAALAPAPA